MWQEQISGKKKQPRIIGINGISKKYVETEIKIIRVNRNQILFLFIIHCRQIFPVKPKNPRKS